MSKRHFHLRLKCSYGGTKNSVRDLQVELLKDAHWEPLELDIHSPGFLLFINGLFSCQHLYMRTNSAERKLILESAEGEMQLNANQQWQIQDISVAFVARLAMGNPTQDDLNYIHERMHHCPVSSNLPENICIQNSVQFV